MPEFKLFFEIVELSEADNWDEAKLEWELSDVYYNDDLETCLCGHYPIKEVCVLKNTENGTRTIVGNCCVKKFERLPSGKIFDALRRVLVDIEKAFNIETIGHAHEKGWINDWEFKFYADTLRKRVLSGKQRDKRIQINEKILEEIVSSHGAV